MAGKFKQKIKFNYAPGQSMEGDGTEQLNQFSAEDLGGGGGVKAQ